MTFEEKEKLFKKIWKWLLDSRTFDKWMPTPEPRIGPKFADFKSIEFGNPAIYNGKPKIRIPSIDQSGVTGGYGKPIQIISDGEWSLICALRGGESNGR